MAKNKVNEMKNSKKVKAKGESKRHEDKIANVLKVPNALKVPMI